MSPQLHNKGPLYKDTDGYTPLFSGPSVSLIKLWEDMQLFHLWCNQAYIAYSVDTTMSCKHDEDMRQFR